MYYFAEEKSIYLFYRIPVFAFEWNSFSLHDSEKLRLVRINTTEKVLFCSQTRCYNPANAVHVTRSVTCLAKDRIPHSDCRMKRDCRALWDLCVLLGSAVWYSLWETMNFHSWFGQPQLIRFKDKPNFTGVIRWSFRSPLLNFSCYQSKKRVNLIQKFYQNIINLYQSSNCVFRLLWKGPGQIYITLSFSYQNVEK